MITEAKDFLEDLIKKHSPETCKIDLVVRNATDEKNAVTNRKFPFAALISRQGSFDETKCRSSGYKKEDGSIQACLIRGERTVPMQIRIHARKEAEAESVIDALIANMPTRYGWGEFIDLVQIRATDLSDFGSNMSEYVIAALVVDFTSDYIKEI